MDIQKIRKKRFLFLPRMYEISEGDENIGANLDEIGKELGYSPEETFRVAQYL